MQNQIIFKSDFQEQEIKLVSFDQDTILPVNEDPLDLKKIKKEEVSDVDLQVDAPAINFVAIKEENFSVKDEESMNEKSDFGDSETDDVKVHTSEMDDVKDNEAHDLRNLNMLTVKDELEGIRSTSSSDLEKFKCVDKSSDMVKNINVNPFSAGLLTFDNNLFSIDEKTHMDKSVFFISGKMVICELCKTGFKSEFDYAQHFTDSKNNCAEVISNLQNGLMFKKGENNIVASSSSVRSYICHECNKTWSSPSKLKTHMYIHTGEKPFSCDRCDKSFSTSSYLKTHLRMHAGLKPFQCEECGKVFSRSSHLKTHLLIHTGENPFQCKECDKAFPMSSYLKTHMRTHAGLRPFPCTECGKAFSRSSDLKAHLRVHANYRPYECKDCSRSFTTSSDLKKHIRRHTGERPFLCKECGKSFTQFGILKIHMRSHTGERPFECPECCKTFFTSSHLKTHMKVHSK